MRPLPVDEILPELLAALDAAGVAVLVAPPGSGKTTRVPPAIPGRVVVLQPRRVAVRAAARRIAQERGWALGGPVGYSTRFERKRSRETRLEFITEGLLLRRLQADPFLEGVDAVVLDEFHERSLALDLSLGLLRELRRDARPDLRLAVMSATLQAEPVARYLGAPVLRAEGRAFPVEVEHARRPGRGPLAPRMAAAIRRAMADEPEGHVLAFLPGVGEIRATADLLRGTVEGRVLPLHGRLPAAEQDRALAPSNRRKVVLSTNVAETSITLEGARVVVDSGLARVARFDPAAGVDRLELKPISHASADQRAGRAGRTGPGRCVRLWTESEGAGRPAHDAPAVRRADLAGALLLLRDQGHGRGFPWFEEPPPGQVARAEALLDALGALDGAGLTSRGRKLLELPVHPRLAAVLLEGAARGRLATAAAAAALASERDPFARCLADGDIDLETRLGLLMEADAGAVPQGTNRAGLREVRRVRDQLLRIAGDAGESRETEPGAAPPLVASLLAGFPDRVARRRGTGHRLKLSSGSGARLPEAGPSTDDLLLVVALGARGRDREPVVDLALPLELDWLAVAEETVLDFDPDRQAVVSRRRRSWGALVLTDRPGLDRLPAEASDLLLRHALEAPDRALAPNDRDEALRARVAFLARAQPRLGLGAVERWADLLPTLCLGRTSFAQLRAADLSATLEAELTWPQRQALDRDAPEHLGLPGGRARVRYPAEGPPVVSARIQQFFGLDATPTLAGVPVTLELLAPNRRPAQVTSDLPGFWRGSYAEVRKQLRGRYPKHPWPEEPWTASPPRRRR